MKKSLIALALLAAAVGNASAATSSGTLTVTGTIESSINLSIGAAGGVFTGSGTADAGSALGTFSKYATAPKGFTIARGSSSYTLSSQVSIRVDKANSTSSSYTLTALLGSAPASGVAWKIDSNTLSDTDATQLANEAAYGTTFNYGWDLVIADSASAGAIDNSINFTATSN